MHIRTKEVFKEVGNNIDEHLLIISDQMSVRVDGLTPSFTTITTYYCLLRSL